MDNKTPPWLEFDGDTSLLPAEHPQPELERIEIDPHGDVLLILNGPRTYMVKRTTTDSDDEDDGSNDDYHYHPTNGAKVEILVSSYALITASAIFKFNVNIDMASTGAAFRLPFPDDNPDAVLVLCRLVHFQLDIPIPKLGLMDHIATLCDKYQCTQVLRFCGSVWLQKHRDQSLNDYKIDDDFIHMFTFAYVADLAQEFNELAWHLLLFHSGRITENSDAGVLADHPLIPMRIVGKFILQPFAPDTKRELNRRRTDLVVEYYNTMNEPFQRTFGAHVAQGCPQWDEEMMRYIRLLTEHGLLGITYDDFMDQMFEDLYINQALRDASKRRNKTTFRRHISVRCAGDKCTKTGKVPPEQPLLDFIDYWTSRDKQAWYGCLDCLKGNNGANECRVRHTK
ncbi:hypothetical protein PspLS_09315 [Pyricularia sp. CBS 133598]|nr:hypothetical protein PspLS_09315 [Pyricularia sp. CBS 133598]